MAEIEAICQDCLRVRPFPSYEAAALAKCQPCSGDMCPCPSCQETIRQLRTGDHHLLLGAITDWSAEDGMVLGEATHG